MISNIFLQTCTQSGPQAYVSRWLCATRSPNRNADISYWISFLEGHRLTLTSSHAHRNVFVNSIVVWHPLLLEISCTPSVMLSWLQWKGELKSVDDKWKTNWVTVSTTIANRRLSKMTPASGLERMHSRNTGIPLALMTKETRENLLLSWKHTCLFIVFVPFRQYFGNHGQVVNLCNVKF